MEASFTEAKKSPDSTDNKKSKQSQQASSKVESTAEAKVSTTAGVKSNMSTTKCIKTGFHKRLLSRLGCQLIIKLIGIEKIIDVVSIS